MLTRIATVTVTARHISAGKMNSTHACPITLAMKDAGFKNPNVDDFISFDSADNFNDISVAAPASAINFINGFDCGEKVKPFTFQFTYQERAAC